MKAAEIYAFAYFGGFALLASVGAVFFFATLLHLQRANGRWMAMALVPLMILGIGISTVLSQRVLTFAYEDIRTIGAGVTAATGGVNVLRLVSATVLGVALAIVVGALFQRDTSIRDRSQLLLVSFMSYFVATTLVNALLGSHPSFAHNSLYPGAVFVAVYMSRHSSLIGFLRAAKYALLALMAGSLVAMVVAPDFAVQPNYRHGWVPGLTIRLWGLGSHANSIGSLALLLLLVEVSSPEPRRALRWLVAVPALAVLLLAQSKTAWAAAAVSLPVLVWFHWGRDAFGRTRLGFVVAMVWCSIALAIMAWAADPVRLVGRLAEGQVGTDVATFTGRFQIWEAAIAAWLQNPGFGYGPEAWGPAHRAAIGLPFAFSAHNQYLGALSSAGLLGLLTLLTYLFVLVTMAWRAANATRGVAPVLALFILVRSVTEVPLDIDNLISGDLVAHLILFRMALEGAIRSRSGPLSEPATKADGFA